MSKLSVILERIFFQGIANSGPARLSQTLPTLSRLGKLFLKLKLFAPPTIFQGRGSFSGGSNAKAKKFPFD